MVSPWEFYADLWRRAWARRPGARAPSSPARPKHARKSSELPGLRPLAELARAEAAALDPLSPPTLARRGAAAAAAGSPFGERGGRPTGPAARV